MYTCIIVDDQEEAVKLVKDHVLKIPQLSILLTTTDSIAALSFLDNNKPDIIFLDIEMPNITGIEFIQNMKAKWGNDIPKVVFTTGYTDYALSGYEHGVVDYLLKPITFSRFKKCTDRIIDDLDKHNNTLDKQKFFFVEDEGKKVKIDFDDIIYVRAEGNYVGVVNAKNKITIYKSMNAMQDQLPCDKFLRVHKSYIVAVDKIQAVSGNDIILKFNNEMIPIGLTYKDQVLRQLGIS